MNRFERVPTALATDVSLSLGARALYPIMLHYAWKNGRREERDAVEVAPLTELARVTGCGTTALKTYLKELRDLGWVHALRGPRGKMQRYLILESPRGSESVLHVGRNPSDSRARDIASDKSTDTNESKNALVASDAPAAVAHPDQPPAHHRFPVEGHDRLQDIVMDTLVEVCDLSGPMSPRFRFAAEALHGKGPSNPGIRLLFWRELLDWAGDNDHRQYEVALLLSEPDGTARFAQALCTAIRQRAALYREKMPGIGLSPTALRDWWFDVKLLPDSNRGLTAQEIARL